MYELNRLPSESEPIRRSVKALPVIGLAMLFLLFPKKAWAGDGQWGMGFQQTASVSETDVSVCLIGIPYEGTPVQVKEVVIKYSDGLIRKIPGESLAFPEGAAPVLEAGTNEIIFSCGGEQYHFFLDALPMTAAVKAEADYREELDSALYSHVSETSFVTIRKYQSEQYEYYLTHVIIADPSQIRSGMSYDSYGGERERPSEASKRLDWIVGTNGSNFNWGSGRPEYAGLCIKNGKVMEGSRTNGMEICLKRDGLLFSPAAGVSGEELLADGVTDTWSCGDTLLIRDGEGINYGIQSNQFRYPRTAVGMVEPGEYYLITAGSGHYEGGMTYDEIREVLLSHGCTFGKCMDGGGSSTLVFENRVVNIPAEGDGRERAVADFLYFTE